MEIKKGDAVKIIAGKDKGKHGVVLKSSPKENKIIVEGINIITKHQRARKANEKSGIVNEPAAFDASNAMIICPLCNVATRVGHQLDENGNKVRVCKKCGGNIDGAKVKAKATVKKANKSSKKKADADDTADAE